MKRKLITFAIMMCALFMCSDIEKRQKPENLPQNAFWVGGLDGGCWMTYNKENSELYQFSIFYENGKLWHKGDFVLHGDTPVDTSTISAYDGERVLLTNGDYLTPEE